MDNFVISENKEKIKVEITKKTNNGNISWSVYGRDPTNGYVCVGLGDSEDKAIAHFIKEIKRKREIVEEIYEKNIEI